ARYEQRNESEREKHRRCKPHLSAPDGAQPVERLDGRRHAYRERDERKGYGGVRAHPAEEHVMTPHEKSKQPDCKYRVDHRAIAEYGFARESRKYVRGQPHARQYGYVDFRVSEKPEQVLPQDGRAAFMLC